MPLHTEQPNTDPPQPAEEIKNDLSLVSSDKLWNELSSRYTVCVMIYESQVKTRPESVPDLMWRGGFYTCLGLIKIGKSMVDRIAAGDVDR